MAVAFDAKCTAVNVIAAGNTTTGNITNLTVGASANALVATAAIKPNSTAVSGVTCTWNSVSLTQIATLNDTSNTGDQIFIFGMIAPATGNKTLVFSWTNSAGGHFDAFSYTGVSQTSVAAAFPSANVLTDSNSFAGGSEPATAFSVTTTSGDMAFGVAESQIGGGWTGVAAGTLRYTSTATPTQSAAMDNAASGSTTSVQFTGGIGGLAAVCAVALRIVQTGGGGGFTPTFRKTLSQIGGRVGSRQAWGD